jgi:hypothetical protein
MAYENQTSILDIGSRFGLWVSAFEILFNFKSKQYVGVWDVIDALDKLEYFYKKIKSKKYSYIKKKINLVQRLYSQLYDARNAYIHGNTIKNSHMFIFGKKSNKPILQVIPFLYKLALLSWMFSTKTISRYDEFDLLQTERNILKCIKT